MRALSISLCTRSTSDLRNVCSRQSSCRNPFLLKLPVSAPSFDESDFSAGAAEDDGGEFIGISSKRNLHSTRVPKPNDISNLVNNCLAELPQMIRQILGRRCARRCLWGRPPQTKRSSVPAAMDRLAPKRSATGPAARQRPRPDAELVYGGEVSF